MSQVITVTEDQLVVVPGDTVQVIETTETSTIIEVAEVGPQGPQGTAGVPGAPGAAGADGTGDSNYEMDFSVQSVVTVNHNLNKYPSTTVLDSAGDVCEGDVDHQSKNTLVITFSAPFSGHVTCN